MFELSQIDSVYIIVPTKTLQDQWASNLISFTDVRINEISFDYKRPFKINILTNLSARKIDFSKISENFAVIFDECHRYGTENNMYLLGQKFIGKLGLTATLDRKYDDGVNQFLIPNIGKIIFDYNLKIAMREGVVEEYKLINLRTYFNEQEQSEYDNLTTKISKLYATSFKHRIETNSNISSNKNLELLIFKRSRLVNDTEQRAYVAAKIILANNKRKKIVFCESIEQAELIQKICRENQLETLVYHSKLNRYQRISNLINFSKNYYHTMIGCKALDEGFDVPDIDFGIIVSQSTTSRQRIQRLGRTIRKFERKLKPVIYTLYTTDLERNVLYEEMVINPEIEVEWLEVK